jgi:hypothetical protein
MLLRSFNVRYRFAKTEKSAPLPEWLADSMDDSFGGDIGLTQTTRVSVHQTKVRLLAAALDAVETEQGNELSAEEVDAALVERGLLSCVERHRAVWSRLVTEPEPQPVPSFEYAFDLYAPSEQEPAFLQCPRPKGVPPVEIADGLRLLPDLGFSVPAQMSAAGETDLAFQLMGYAGALWYYKGKPTTSRPLGQAIAVEVPGRPAWRVRHELGVLLRGIEESRESFGLRGGVVFAWLLPFLPGDKPIPRVEQHPLLLDVPSPLRVQADRRVAVYNRPCSVGGSDLALPTAALAHKKWWAASGLPAVAFTKRTKSDKKVNVDAYRKAGLDPAPDLMQRPYGKIPSSQDLLDLLRSTPMGGGREGLHPPVLTAYHLLEDPEPIEDQAGAELVVEGEPIGATKTELWLDVRIPLPEPQAGAETGEARWRGWQAAVERQLDARGKLVGRLAAAAKAGWLGRKQSANQNPSPAMKAKAGEFARRWTVEFETETDPALWAIAARTWSDKAQNDAQWRGILDKALQRAAMRAFESLGGFDSSVALLAATGLLALAEGRVGSTA